MLVARQFADAYHAVQEYEGREGQTQPSGPLADAVMGFIREKLEARRSRHE